jgi:acyl carrier protein phosphodiesterase
LINDYPVSSSPGSWAISVFLQKPIHKTLNFLAHLMLSDLNEPVMVGNFISDHIKGKKYLEYPPEVIDGILLHRKIDSFTDTHPSVLNCTRRLHSQFHKYSGAITDIFFDHFLAVHWNNYSNFPLNEFITWCYEILHANLHLMPEKPRYMLPFMIEFDWLGSYLKIEGIRMALKGLSRRARYRNDLDLAINVLQKHYDEFAADFNDFFPDMILEAGMKSPLRKKISK